MNTTKDPNDLEMYVYVKWEKKNYPFAWIIYFIFYFDLMVKSRLQTNVCYGIKIKIKIKTLLTPTQMMLEIGHCIAIIKLKESLH